MTTERVCSTWRDPSRNRTMFASRTHARAMTARMTSTAPTRILVAVRAMEIRLGFCPIRFEAARPRAGRGAGESALRGGLDVDEPRLGTGRLGDLLRGGGPPRALELIEPYGPARLRALEKRADDTN